MKYCVSRKEIHTSFVYVDATSPEEAKRLVADGQGDMSDYLEYNSTLDPEKWTVDEVKEWRERKANPNTGSHKRSHT